MTDIVAERSRVIRESGWGARFRFVQPRNLAFWVYLVVVGYGVLIMSRYITAGTNRYGSVISASVILFALYGALFWWFTHRIDRYAGQSAKLIVTGFVWGAFGAITMASFANTPILSLWSKAISQRWSLDWGAGLTAPFTEEFAKGLGLLLLIALAPRLVASAFDGFILGAFIGLGFQIVEDITYAVGAAGTNFGADPVPSVLQVLLMRMVTGVAGHILFSSIFCAGLVYFLGRPAQPRRRGRGVALILTAMALHGIWDDNSGIFGRIHPQLPFLTMIVLLVIAVLIVIRVFNLTVPPEREFMRTVLAPEVANGTVTEEELSTLSGDRKARRAYIRAGDKRDHRCREHVLQAVDDLADELARSGGAESDRVAFARSEVERLRHL